MELVQVRDARELSTEPPQKRMRSAPSSPVTTLFKAVDDGEEVAFVAIDLWPTTDTLVLYELFVHPARRGAGVGTAVLVAVEEYTRSIGRTRVVLKAHPLDTSIGEDDLIKWYERRGYVLSAADSLYFKDVDTDSFN